MKPMLMVDDQLEIAESAFIAPGAQLVGHVTVDEDSSIWFNAVLRGDTDVIRVGKRTSVQDGTVIHCDNGYPTVIGDDVTVGHGCIIHGAVIENNVLVGMGARILSGAHIGEYSFLAAGTLILEGVKIPPHSLVMGFPGKVIRAVDDMLMERIRLGAEHYAESAALYRKRYGK